MKLIEQLWAMCAWTPSFAIVCIFLIGWGIFLFQSKNLKPVNWISFGIAWLLTILALGSPVTVLAEIGVFSAHMLQHILLLMLIPPLLWLSIPEKNNLPPIWLTKLQSPLLAWGLGIGLMWLLHFPFVFNETMSPLGSLALCSGKFANSPLLMEWMHPLHVALTLGIGLCFTLPILAPWKTMRLAPLKGVGFLVTACTACSVLGIVITFAPVGTYANFAMLPDITGIQHQLQNTWALSPATDQQIGGLLMWVPGCFIYLSGSMYLLNVWFHEEELPYTFSEYLNPPV